MSFSSGVSTNNQDLALTKSESGLLLLIFIHGFKGTDETFGDFPKRLEHILTELMPQTKTEAVVFPAYETKGDLVKAVDRFADWLATLTVEREVASGLGAGKAKVVLCGHSMGGLLAADSLREIVDKRPDKAAPIWPKIVGCIAFDTPYYGIHPFVVKNGVTKAAQYANAATTVGSAILGSFAMFGAKKAAEPAESTPPAKTSRSATPPPGSQSPWSGWAGTAAVGSAILAGAAAAGAAYYKKDDLNLGLSWATDHLKYVGELWDTESLDKRIQDLVKIEKDYGVVFRNLYSVLPPNPPEFLDSRTFVVLPKYSSGAKAHFLPATNATASDEIKGHVGMFSGRTNDGYYKLGLDSANIIRDAVLSSREFAPSNPGPKHPKPGLHPPVKETQDQPDLIQF